MIHFLSGVEVCKFRNKKYQTNSHTHTYKSNVHVYIFLDIFSKIKLSSINHSTFEILFAYFCESKLYQISSMSRMKPFESEYYFIAFHLTGYTLESGESFEMQIKLSSFFYKYGLLNGHAGVFYPHVVFASVAFIWKVTH